MNQNKEKYIVIKTEIFEAFNEKYPTTPQDLARLIVKHPEAILENKIEGEDEYFVLMLKDVHARPALIAYARSAAEKGHRLFSQMVSCLAERAGILSRFVKEPD